MTQAFVETSLSSSSSGFGDDDDATAGGDDSMFDIGSSGTIKFGFDGEEWTADDSFTERRAGPNVLLDSGKFEIYLADTVLKQKGKSRNKMVSRKLTIARHYTPKGSGSKAKKTFRTEVPMHCLKDFERAIRGVASMGIRSKRPTLEDFMDAITHENLNLHKPHKKRGVGNDEVDWTASQKHAIRDAVIAMNPAAGA